MSSDAAPPKNQINKWYQPTKAKDDKALRAAALIQETADIEQYQSAWHQLNLWNAVLYGNRELVGFNWGVVRENSRELWPTNLHTENVIQECGDSFMAKASSSPLKPTPVPHGNSWKTERAVRVLDQFITATWRQTESEDACVRAFLDSFISSVGCVQDVYDADTNTLCCEPIFFDQIVIDNRECINRQEPRTVRIRKVLPRAAIEAKWDIDFDKDFVQPTKRRYVDYREVGDGWEVLVEAYRRPVNGKGGYHAIACRGHMLADEVWKKDWLPFEFMHWGERLSGFFMQSGVEMLVPYQVRQNELNDAIRESQDIACRPRILRHANSMIDDSEWDNLPGRFMTYSGEKPETFQWPTQLGELYQERERNKAAAKSHVGLSEMFVNADPPPQVRFDSSAGLREARNMEDSRHLRLWTRYQDFRLRVAKMHLRVLGLHEKASAYTAVYHPARANARAQSIPFEAVKTLNENEYSWTLDAASMAQLLPAARRETLRDFISRGMAEPGEGYRMVGAVNLERDEMCELASYDDVDRHIGLMEEEDYEAPTEITNLTYGIKAVRANIHRLKCYDDVPPAIIELHLQWLATAAAIQVAATAPEPSAPFAPTQGLPGTNAAMAPRTLIQNNSYGQPA